MQAILKLFQAFLWAWQFAKENPRKSIAAGVGVGATSAAMLMSGVTYPPALITAANTTNAPGSNGQVLESNGDNTYTFGEPGGVGGGATELAELDDVSDTLAGAQGDFIGWDGADWDDIEVTIDTLTDVTITAAATGEVLRYNGSAWVDSALSVDDLSEVTITSLASGEVLRYNGSALVDATLSIDDLTEVTITSAADDQFLRYNGSAWVNETVSLSASVDATGIADGYVYTADGDATPAWEAPAVGGLLTPDGGTAITRSTSFDPFDYGASYLNDDQFVTWTTSTQTFTVDTGTDIVTFGGAHGLTDGDGICVTTTTTLPALSSGTFTTETRYYADVLSSTTVSLHTTRAAATAGTGDLNFTDTGSGTHTGRLKTTVTFNNSSGTPTASANTYTAGHWMMLHRAGKTPTIGAPQNTVDGIDASYATKVGTDPTWTHSGNVVTLSGQTPLVTADPVRVSNSGGALPTGVDAVTTYYWRRVSGTATGTSLTGTLHANTTDANSGASVIALSGGSGTQTMLGYTEWYATARAGDGNGGWTAALSTPLSLFTWNYRTAGQMTYGTKFRFDVPTLSRSLAIYFGASSNRNLATILDTNGQVANPNTLEDAAQSFSGVSTASAGAASQLTSVSAEHDFVVDDIVELNSTSGSDEEYDTKKKVTAVTSTTVTINQAFTDTAAGYVGPAFDEWVDYGSKLQRDSNEGRPNVENASYEWRADVVMPLGTKTLDTGSDRLFNVHETTMLDDPFTTWSGLSAPTWVSTANTDVSDGQNTLRRSVEYVPLEDTTGAVRGYLRAKVQTSSSTTAVLQDAAFGDNASNALLASHDDTMPWRNCIAAAQTWAKGATIKARAGDSVIFTPALGTTDPDGVTWWTNVLNTNQPQYRLFILGGSNRTFPFALDFDPAFTLRVRDFGTLHRVDAPTVQSGSSAVGYPSQSALFAVVSQRFMRRGGRIVWEDYAGGLSEHDTIQSCESGFNLYSMSATPGGTSVYDDGQELRFAYGHDYFPSWFEAGGNDDNHSLWTSANFSVDHYSTFVGGGDGNQTLFANGGFRATEWRAVNYRGLCSHGFYGGVAKRNYSLDGCQLWGFDSPGKNGMQFRGEANNEPIADVSIVNVDGQYSNQLQIGDNTSGNPVLRAQLNGIRGFSGVVLDAEAQNVQLDNIIAPVTITEDCRNIQIGKLHGNLLAAATDNLDGLTVESITNANIVNLANIQNGRISKIKLKENWTTTPTSVLDLTRDWVATGLNTEYYLTNWATGGTPGISQPAYSLQNGVVTEISTTNIGEIPAGTGAWGNVEYQTVAISGSPTGGDYTLTYNGNTSGAIAAGATAATFETALRLLAGATAVNVSTTGSGNNLTYHITNWAAGSDPPQMTSTSALTGGSSPTITHATPTAYPGYDTLIVKMTDTAVTPDEHPNGWIQIADAPSATTSGLLLGDLSNVTIDGIDGFRTDNASVGIMTRNGTTTTASYRNDVTIRNVKYTHLGLPTSIFRIVDFGSGSASTYKNVVLENFFLRCGSSSTARQGPFRATCTPGSDITLRNWDWTRLVSNDSEAGFEVSSVANGRLENSKIGSNRQLVKIDTTADTWAALTTTQVFDTAAAGATTPSMTLSSNALTDDDAYNNLSVYVQHANGIIEQNWCTDYVGSTKVATMRKTWKQTPSSTSKYWFETRECIDANVAGANPFPCWLEAPVATLPGGFTAKLLVWSRNDNKQFWDNRANAVTAGATGKVAITGANTVCWLYQADLAGGEYHSTRPPLGATNAAWVRSHDGNNEIRGARSWSYPITVDTGNLQLQPVNTHLFTSDADANVLTGVLGFPVGQRMTFAVSQYSTNDLNLDHQDSVGSTTNTENEFTAPTGADVALDPGDSKTLTRPSEAERIVIEGN